MGVDSLDTIGNVNDIFNLFQSLAMATPWLLRHVPKGRIQWKGGKTTSIRCITGGVGNGDYNIQGTIPSMGRGVDIGQYAEVERSFSPEEVKQFGALVKDHNFLHQSVPWSDDIETMQTTLPVTEAHVSEGLVIRDNRQPDTEMTIPLVHGILLSSMFSSIFASLVPGCIYINQTLHFSSPVFANELVKSRVTIEKLRRWPKGGIVVQCNTQIQKVEDDGTTIKGTANVWLPEGHRKSN